MPYSEQQGGWSRNILFFNGILPVSLSDPRAKSECSLSEFLLPLIIHLNGSFNLQIHIKFICLYVLASFLDVKLCENEFFYWLVLVCC